MDIGLDCFPHNSGTTLFESLYMGVPYITLADRPSMGRLGSSILEGIGHPDWIAATEEEYIDKTINLAGDLQRLSVIRMNLRTDMTGSPLMDEIGFTKKMDTAFLEMFLKWEEASLPTLPPKAVNITKTKKQTPHKTPSKTTQTASPRPAELQQLAQLFAHGQKDEALSLATRLTEQFPRHGFAWKVLGPLLFQQGMKKEALEAMSKAAEYLTGDVESHTNLGIALEQSGLLAEAEQSYKRAIQCDKKHIQAHYNLANILKDQKRLTEAETQYKLVLKLKPDLFEACCNLGNVLKDQGWLTEAETYYIQAIKIKPESPEVHYNLGNTLRLQKRLPEAIRCFIRTLQLNPAFTKAHNNLGVCFKEQGLFSHADAAYRQAIQLDPHYADAYSNMGSLASLQGKISEAEAYLTRALELSPDQARLHSNLLFTLNYHPDKNGEEIFQHYKDFNTRFGLPLQQKWQAHKNSCDVNRRLKIGYVCPQFCQHPIVNFLEPLLANHDKQKMEIYAYADILQEDTATSRYKNYVDHWVPTTTLDDLELTQRIRTDNIDILIDIAGHTGGNRLLVFARKPAPVSLHWLDFGYTTGLTAIDYYLTDGATVPAGSEDLFSETPWRLETPCLVYRPTTGMGEVSALPAAAKGHITFGTLTRAVRINHRTIRVWVEILKKTANSILIINSGSFQDPAMQKEFTDKFTALGIDRERLEIGYQSPPWDVLRRIDIGFDCFPHNSGTTLFENLYMGVPFITLAERPSVGRLGCSILEGIGHPEWIAQTEEEYIEKAVALAGDLPELAKLRAGLRQEMERSPLMDEPAFTRKVETAYRDMFAKWCEEQQ
jgi:predicted O-linked N-acetylglucosamine transferase (SPINDLY family)